MPSRHGAGRAVTRAAGGPASGGDTRRAWLLLAALCWAASILYVRSHRWVTPPFELVFWQALLATCLLVPLALILGGIGLGAIK